MANYSTYFAIEKGLKKQGFDFERPELIKQFTNGRKTGLTALSDHEYKEFINWLNLKFTQTRASPGPPSKANERQNIQRRKIISLFRQMGYEKENKADMQRIYSWVLKYGYLKKSLNQYTADELPKLVTQAENVYKTFLEGI